MTTAVRSQRCLVESLYRESGEDRRSHAPAKFAYRWTSSDPISVRSVASKDVLSHEQPTNTARPGRELGADADKSASSSSSPRCEVPRRNRLQCDACKFVGT